MADRKLPLLDSLMLCTRVEYDDERRVEKLVEPLHTVLLEPNRGGLYVLPPLALHALMTDEDAQGTFRLRVQVRSETNIVLDEHTQGGVDVTFVTRYSPVRPFEHVFEVRDVVLPAPGAYHFHVMGGHVSLSDRPNSARPAKLRVIAAEPGDES